MAGASMDAMRRIQRRSAISAHAADARRRPTTADGLPSNSIRSIAVLSDGSKLIGTDSGLARYAGP